MAIEKSLDAAAAALEAAAASPQVLDYVGAVEKFESKAAAAEESVAKDPKIASEIDEVGASLAKAAAAVAAAMQETDSLLQRTATTWADNDLRQVPDVADALQDLEKEVEKDTAKAVAAAKDSDVVQAVGKGLAKAPAAVNAKTVEGAGKDAAVVIGKGLSNLEGHEGKVLEAIKALHGAFDKVGAAAEIASQNKKVAAAIDALGAALGKAAAAEEAVANDPKLAKVVEDVFTNVAAAVEAAAEAVSNDPKVAESVMAIEKSLDAAAAALEAAAASPQVLDYVGAVEKFESKAAAAAESVAKDPKMASEIDEVGASLAKAAAAVAAAMQETGSLLQRTATTRADNDLRQVPDVADALQDLEKEVEKDTAKAVA